MIRNGVCALRVQSKVKVKMMYERFFILLNLNRVLQQHVS